MWPKHYVYFKYIFSYNMFAWQGNSIIIYIIQYKISVMSKLDLLSFAHSFLSLYHSENLFH